MLSQLFREDDFGVLRTRIVTMLYDMISEKVQRENGTFEKRVSLLLPFLLVHNVTFDPHFLWAPPGADCSGGSGPITGRLA